MVRSSQYKNKIDTHDPNALRFLGKENIIRIVENSCKVIVDRKCCICYDRHGLVGFLVLDDVNVGS